MLTCVTLLTLHVQPCADSQPKSVQLASIGLTDSRQLTVTTCQLVKVAQTGHQLANLHGESVESDVVLPSCMPQSHGFSRSMLGVLYRSYTQARPPRRRAGCAALCASCSARSTTRHRRVPWHCDNRWQIASHARLWRHGVQWFRSSAPCCTCSSINPWRLVLFARSVSVAMS